MACNVCLNVNSRADRWFLSVNTDVTPRAYHGLCALNNLIYMIGGFDGHEHFNTVRCFDPVTKEWRERACMYHARCYVSVCTHGESVSLLSPFLLFAFSFSSFNIETAERSSGRLFSSTLSIMMINGGRERERGRAVFCCFCCNILRDIIKVMGIISRGGIINWIIKVVN